MHQKKAARAPDIGQQINDALNRRDLATAARLMTEVADAGAATPQLLHVLGEVLYNLGDVDAAERRLREAIAADPALLAARFALGLLLVKQERFADAVDPLAECLRQNPNHEGAAFNLAVAREKADDPAGALQLYTRVIQINPRNGRALNNIGAISERNDRPDQALTYFLRAAEVEPETAEGWRNAVRLAEKLDKPDLAERLLHIGVKTNPDPVDAVRRLGEFLIRQNRPGEAEHVLRAALEDRPDDARLLSAIAAALVDRGLYDEAAATAQRAIENDPKLAAGYFNRGRALAQIGAHSEAAKLFKEGACLAKSPRPFLFEAAMAHRAAKEIEQALTVMLRAVFAEDEVPGSAEAVVRDILETGDVPDSIVEAIGSMRDQEAAVSPIVSFAAMLGSLGRHDSMRRIYGRIDPRHLSSLTTWSTYAFVANYDPGITAEDLFQHYKGYAEAGKLADLRPALIPADHLRDKLRIGYMSPDFRAHSMINFIKPIIEGHDRSAVEVYAYGELRLGDDETKYLQDAVDNWYLTTRVPDDQVAEQVRRDRVDILVDLAGHTSGNRLSVFPYRPAPATATWLGYLYTTAVPGVDYFIGDHITSPPEAAHLFTENLVRLPHYLACYTPSPKAPEAISPLPADTNGHVTFGNCSRVVRLNSDVLAAWAEILARIPSARLLLDHPDFGDPWCAMFIRNRLAEAGAPMDRVEVLNSGDYWGFYSRVDLVLDTFPHASGTTTCEAMYMGVPVLAIADRPSVGRLGAAMVDTVGHPEWIGWNVPEYVRKAVLMAADTDRLRAIRATLRDELLGSVICDKRRFMANLEEAYRIMWRNACEGRHRAIDLFDDVTPAAPRRLDPVLERSPG